MPIIAQVMLGANFREDGIVEILRDEITECGCVSLLTEAERHNMSVERIRSVFQSMNGVTCSDEKCCVTDLSVFSANMKKLAGGE